METSRYVGMDVHTEWITIAVLNAQGKMVRESVIETRAQTVLDFVKGIRGTGHVTFEEGTPAAWLYEVLRPHAAKVIVSDPRKNKFLLTRNKGDRVAARKLAQLLRAGLVTPVSQGEHGTRTLKELARSSEGLVRDRTRGMNRLKALYRARAIPGAGESVYTIGGREEWLGKSADPGARRRAEHRYQALGSPSLPCAQNPLVDLLCTEMVGYRAHTLHSIPLRFAYVLLSPVL
jgi:transposase